MLKTNMMKRRKFSRVTVMNVKGEHCEIIKDKIAALNEGLNIPAVPLTNIRHRIKSREYVQANASSSYY